MKRPLIFTIVATFLISCASGSSVEQTTETENVSSTESTKVGYTDFLDEILIGFQMAAITKHMAKTPYKFLGETELLMNYEAIDDNKVKYFLSFLKDFDAPEDMFGLSLSIDFDDNNAHLVNEYQENLIQQLDAVYGEWSDDFVTGYNMYGNYEADWYFEAGILHITIGTNFINIDLNAN